MGILRSNIKVRVPLSQIHYDTNEFRFKWNEVWLTVPYRQQPLRIKGGRLLEGFKNNLASEITISFRWHRTRHCAEEMKVLADESALKEIENITSRVETLISEIKSLMASGTLNLNEARGVMATSKLKYNDEIIHRILADIVHRMPGQQIEIELQVPLSQLHYDSHCFRFKWNEAWLAVPYEQQHLLKTKHGSFLEIFKGILKTKITIRISWNRIFQNIDDIRVKTSSTNVEEIDDISSRIEQCVSDIQSLVKTRELSLEKAQAALVARGLESDDGKIHEILSEIIDKMEPQKEPVSVKVPLRDIEYGQYEVTFHYLGKSFQVDKDELHPFEIGPILNKIKSQLKGAITFRIDRDCLVKWDRNNTKLLVGDVRMGVERVDIAPATLDSFKELRAKVICDAINALDKKTISIEQVKLILEEWGLDLDQKEIGEMIASSIPQWEVELSFQVPADQVEYSSDGITCALGQGRKEFIPSTELPFGTGDVLDGIKGMLEGNINVAICYDKGFIWDKEDERLAIRQGKKSYKVTADDEFLRSIKFLDVPFVYPSDEGTVSGPTRIDSYGRGHPRKKGYYHPRCSVFLKSLVEQAKGDIYMTSVDLWLKIDDILIWERPKYSAATYFFHWPSEPIEKFIHETWGRTLEYIRNNGSKTGYITRATHDHEYGLASWKREMKGKILEHASIRIS
jgi:hypothetical protein